MSNAWYTRHTQKHCTLMETQWKWPNTCVVWNTHVSRVFGEGAFVVATTLCISLTNFITPFVAWLAGTLLLLVSLTDLLGKSTVINYFSPQIKSIKTCSIWNIRKLFTRCLLNVVNLDWVVTDRCQYLSYISNCVVIYCQLVVIHLCWVGWNTQNRHQKTLYLLENNVTLKTFFFCSFLNSYESFYLLQ